MKNIISFKERAKTFAENGEVYIPRRNKALNVTVILMDRVEAHLKYLGIEKSPTETAYFRKNIFRFCGTEGLRIELHKSTEKEWEKKNPYFYALIEELRSRPDL